MAKVTITFEDEGDDLTIKFLVDPPINYESPEEWTAAQSAAHVVFSYITEQISENDLQSEIMFDDTDPEDL